MKRTSVLTVCVGMLFSTTVVAQPDDDHTITNFGGVTYLAPNALAPVAPTGFTVGTTANTAAALVVDGAQLGHLNTFWSHASQPNLANWQTWRMNKTIPGLSNIGIGNIFSRGGTDHSFNIDALSGDLRLHTNAVPRAALFYRVSNASINGSSFNQSGYFGLSGRQQFFDWLTSSGSPGPLSRLHLVDGVGSNTPSVYAPTLGFRGWMRNGITFTGNSDQMYIGHKYGASDGISRAVLQFSEGTLDANRQFMSMVFTADPSSGGAAASPDGLEIMRLWPETNTSGYVGIGDFNTATTNPTERLDLLDRTIRLQAFASGSPVSWQDPTSTYDRVLVANPADGRIYWRPATDFGAPSCEWSMNTASPNHVSTAFGTASATCPDDAEAVGIGVNLGTSSPAGKLDVRTTGGGGLTTALNVSSSGGTPRGIAVASTAGTGCASNTGMFINATGSGTSCTWTNVNYGLRANVTGASWWTRGVSAVANCGSGVDMWSESAGEFISSGFARYTEGVNGYVYGGTVEAAGLAGFASSDVPLSTGVRGKVLIGTLANTYIGTSGTAQIATLPIISNTGAVIRGVYGNAPTGAAGFPFSYALYGDGDCNISGTIFLSSDQQLKENIEVLSNGLDQIMQLEPKRYTYRTDEFSFLNLSGGQHIGLIAQEVEAVLPDLVRTIRRPSDIDSLGNATTPELDYKALNYMELIPLLISAVKEQNATITALQDEVAGMQSQSDAIQALQEQLALLSAEVMNCCAIGGDGMQGQGAGDQRGLVVDGDLVGEGGNKLTIQPNPFGERTTLYYTVERAGRAQLMVNSADGKQLRVLNEAVLEPGQYQYEWNTADLNPGMYYVTFLLNGEPIVKKAVRVRE